MPSPRPRSTIDVAVLDPLDDAVDDLADAVLELLVLALALGLADLAGDHLAGHLGLHAAELERRQDLLVDLADDGFLVVLQRVGEALLGVVVSISSASSSTTVTTRRDGGLAGLRVDGDADVVLGAVAGAGGLLDRLLDRLDDDLLLDRLLAGDRVGDLQQLEPVGGDAGDGSWGYSFASVARRWCRGGRLARRPRRASSARRSGPAWRR